MLCLTSKSWDEHLLTFQSIKIWGNLTIQNFLLGLLYFYLKLRNIENFISFVIRNNCLLLYFIFFRKFLNFMLLSYLWFNFWNSFLIELLLTFLFYTNSLRCPPLLFSFISWNLIINVKRLSKLCEISSFKSFTYI